MLDPAVCTVYFSCVFMACQSSPRLDDMSEAGEAASAPSITEDIFTPDEPPSQQPGHQPYPVALFTETYVK